MTLLRGWARRIPLLPLTLIAATAIVILSVMSPWLVFTPTTPTGGDTGAHVFGPAYLRDNLLPEGRIIGWSNDWFAGFPAFYFYFPLPSLVIVALDVLLPYGVAFKLVTLLGLVALPPAIYFHARAMKLGRHVSIVAAGAGAVFAFYESFSIYGGNIASTLAGEFSYSWSFSLSLVYLGLLMMAIRDDKKYTKWAALALALTALSHVLTTIVAVFASIFVLSWKKGFGRTLVIWVWGFMIAAFWALPLLARIGLTSDMGWTPLGRWEEIFPVELWLLLLVAVPAAVWALIRTPRAAPMIAATLLPVIYFPLPGLLPEILPGLFDGQRWKLWNGRLLPYWYFGVAFFAAIGFGAAVVWLTRRMPRRVSSDWARVVVVAVFAVASGLTAASTEFPAFAWVGVALIGGVALAVSFMIESTPNWSKTAPFILVGAGIFFCVGYLFSGRWPDPSAFPVWMTVAAVVVAVGLVLRSFRAQATLINSQSLMTSAALVVVVLGAASGVTFVDGWSRWNYEGYEKKAAWFEYRALMTELNALPDGRVMWENNSGLNKYGTPMSPMLIPYWTEGSHQSMEGLYFESSITTPFHFINHSEMSYQSSNPIPGLRYHPFDMERGIKHMDIYGVDYYVSFTPEAAAKADEIAELEKLTTAEPFHIYRLPPTNKVEVATHLPAVYEVPQRGLFAVLIGTDTVYGPDGASIPSFHDFSLEWYEEVDEMHRWVVADGPAEWPRIQSLDQRPDVELGAGGTVGDIVVEDHRIAFTTDAVGVPHLVKVSYFPNWTATGADGPWRASPSLMVVVPTATEVEIVFENTWAESGGRVLTVVGVVALLGAAGYVFIRRRANS